MSQGICRFEAFRDVNLQRAHSLAGKADMFNHLLTVKS